MQGDHIAMTLFQFWVTLTAKDVRDTVTLLLGSSARSLPQIGLCVAYNEFKSGFRPFSELKHIDMSE